MENLNKATFGAGCFWCIEAVFQNLKGVKSVVSGYTGGRISNPTYREVCSGLTGHAEVIEVTFDPAEISFDDLLDIFWQTHDPTTPNQQGADHGSQYRSAIFYHSEAQRDAANAFKNKLDASGEFDKPIVTEISPAEPFYKAEESHQNYYQLNSEAPYCQYVIVPKVKKLQKLFADKLQ